MSLKSTDPTPFPEVNAILQKLLEDVKSVLGSHFIGMYLEGSLANGGFDQDSDIDFVVVTDADVSENIFIELRDMHERIAAIDSLWAVQLECFYISRSALRRHDPEHARVPNIERGNGERLKLVPLDETWNIHRYILRQYGITLFGPDLETLIDPVSPDDLRRLMLPTLHGWGKQILNNPNEITNRGYQSYTVLSLCRILYTLQFGDVVSKVRAASWAKETVDKKRKALIDRALVGRHNSQLTASADDINQTLDYIYYAIERSLHV